MQCTRMDQRIPAIMRRIYGLDTWRAALLIVGPFIHSAPSGYLSDASSLFRMPAFFFVAGFLGGHGAVKRPSWLKDRLIQLVGPTMVVWVLVLTPIKIATGKNTISDLYNPDHLWFLIDLAVSTFFIHIIFLSKNVKSIFFDLKSHIVVLGYIIVSALISCFIYPLDHISGNKIIVSLAQAPIFSFHYAVGYIISQKYQHTDYVKNAKSFYVGLFTFSVCFVVIRYYHDELRMDHQYRFLKFSIHGLKGLCGATVSIGILASALKMNWRPNIVHTLSRSSYSIYLLHVPVIMMADYIISLENHSFIRYAVLVTCGLSIPWVIHNNIISKSASMFYIFNGVKKHGLGAAAI